ncbi:MAG TPA: glycosyl hydrolase, partial [Tepidisphaeraceae bacterium]|nr:glycosyl hydrolase [Tepidisphaeraceae bacterium]
MKALNLAGKVLGFGSVIVLWSCAGSSQTQSPPTATAAPATQPVPIVEELHSAGPTSKFVSSQPDVPYLPKPAAQPADWVVEHDPVTPNASPQAKALLHFLYSISGKHTIVGQHNYPNQQEIFTQAAAKLYGKTPALYGTDWGFAKPGDKDSAYVRRDEVQEIIKQYHNGSIIAICWHEVRPTEDEPVTFMGSVRQKITDAQFEEVLTPGTPLNKHWAAQVDVIAEYLKQLQDAHVPVLWRPYHEINGNQWFWWNGRRGERGTKALYRQLFDRLVNFHKINNLIWVWNPDQPTSPDKQFVDFFPGHDVVDVLALDDYAVLQQSYYDDLNALSDGKVLAISECGNNIPNLDVYKTQPKWTYFMRWAFGPGPQRGPTSRPTTR